MKLCVGSPPVSWQWWYTSNHVLCVAVFEQWLRHSLCNIAHIPATAFLRYCRDRYRPLMPYHVEHLSYPAVERISDQRIRDLSKAVSFRPMCIRSSLSALEIGIYPWRSLPGALWVLSRSRSSQRSRLTRGYRFPLVTGSPSRSAYPPWWCCPKESFHCESVT